MTPAAAIKEYVTRLKKIIKAGELYGVNGIKVADVKIKPAQVIYENGTIVRYTSPIYLSLDGVWLDFKCFYTIDSRYNKPVPALLRIKEPTK